MTEGKALVDLAQRLGQEAEQIVFASTGHGSRAAAADVAIAKLVAWEAEQKAVETGTER